MRKKIGRWLLQNVHKTPFLKIIFDLRNADKKKKERAQCLNLSKQINFSDFSSNNNELNFLWMVNT